MLLDPSSLTWIGILILVADILALGSIWTSKLHSTKAKLFWTLVVALLPLLGAAAWFPLGREIRR